MQCYCSDNFFYYQNKHSAPISLRSLISDSKKNTHHNIIYVYCNLPTQSVKLFLEEGKSEDTDTGGVSDHFFMVKISVAFDMLTDVKNFNLSKKYNLEGQM